MKKLRLIIISLIIVTLVASSYIPALAVDTDDSSYYDDDYDDYDEDEEDEDNDDSDDEDLDDEDSDDEDSDDEDENSDDEDEDTDDEDESSFYDDLGIYVFSCAPKEVIFQLEADAFLGNVAEAYVEYQDQRFDCKSKYLVSEDEECEEEDDDPEFFDEDVYYEYHGNSQSYEYIIDDDYDDGDGDDFDADENLTFGATYDLNIGDVISIVVVMDNGQSVTEDVEIGETESVLEIADCNVDNTYFMYCSDFDHIDTLTINAAGKTVSYQDSDEEIFDELYCDYEDLFDNIETFASNYCIKANQTVTITIETTTGYTITKTAKARQIKPELKLNDVYAGDAKITGQTKAGSTVTATVNNKKFTAKAGINGQFAIKVDGFKFNTKIKVDVKTTQDCTNSASLKTKKVTGKITLKNVTKKDKNVIATVTNARKGDTVKLKVGKTTYKQTIKKNVKALKLTFKIKKQKAKTNITAAYSDRFGTAKGSASVKVK